jgi:hypothetical protein
MASANEKMCRAWNEMVTANRKIHENLYEDETITVTIDEEETELNYNDDIYPEICLSDNIFCSINSYNI